MTFPLRVQTKKSIDIAASNFEVALSSKSKSKATSSPKVVDFLLAREQNRVSMEQKKLEWEKERWEKEKELRSSEKAQEMDLELKKAQMQFDLENQKLKMQHEIELERLKKNSNNN